MVAASTADADADAAIHAKYTHTVFAFPIVIATAKLEKAHVEIRDPCILFALAPRVQAQRDGAEHAGRKR
jgi:hypothetical protein